MMYDFKQLDRFVAFVIERHRIYERRNEGKPEPWTKDKILSTYRFCNVYRELDRVTLWIKDNWRDPFADHPDLWFWMVIARLINHPDTLSNMRTPDVWDKRDFIRVIHARQKEKVKAFGSAYIVSTNGTSVDKAVYLADSVLDPMWAHRDVVRPQSKDRLRDFYSRLMECQGMGSFMAAQVIADMKYVGPLADAKDWWTFAASGPGSRKGMSYLLGFNPSITKWKEHEWKDVLMELSEVTRPLFKDAGLPRIHNQDLQNCLCEFSKYRRTQLGTGRPKQKFTPHSEDNG